LVISAGIKVEQCNTEEGWGCGYKCRAVSVAVSRKQYVAVDAISDLENGVFLFYNCGY